MLTSVAYVSITGPDPKELKFQNRPFYSKNNSGVTSLSASGIILQDRFILTHGTLVLPFLKNRETYQFDETDTCINPSTIVGTSINITFHNSNKSHSAKLCCLVKNSVADKCKATTFFASLNPYLDIDQLLQGNWYWGWNEAHTLNNLNRSTASQYALLMMNDPHSCSKHFKNSISILDNPSPSKQIDEIFVVGSPFGLLSEIFQNSVTKGVISNLITNKDENQLAFLTDARMLPGTEGGGVFDSVNKKCIAVCTLPLRNSTSLVEMNLIISLNALLPQLRRHVDKYQGLMLEQSPALGLQQECKIIGNADQCVVLIHVGNCWGTGVIVSANGYILTNAHLVRPFLVDESNQVKDSIVVFLSQNLRDLKNNRKFNVAKLICVSKNGPLDVALLKIDKDLKDFFDLNVKIKTERGSDVYAVGYPLFMPLSTSGAIRNPTCTKGCLSSIVVHKKSKIPCLMQTSALIHFGNSGGAIVNSIGNLIGLVTSNARHFKGDGDQDHKLIPSMNFAIPVQSLQMVSKFISSEINLKQLDEWMNAEDEDMRSIWSFDAQQRNKQANKKKGKSKFLKMMDQIQQKSEDSEKDKFLSSRL
ncbi:glyoxysomal processing protease [Acrasis kona]|uniref:Glyoxysomal processing protease n=1 Tax=Acrasis kona TaxID=1008807 RepID=A0AAW2ZL62_9EUKA